MKELWQNKTFTDKILPKCYYSNGNTLGFPLQNVKVRISNRCFIMWSTGVKQFQCLARDGQGFICTVRKAENEVI